MRREITVTITDKNRDSGKVFVLTEMPASVAERWADRAILAVGHSGANIDYVKGKGVAGIAVLGFKALFGINEASALALADEMFSCVQIKVPAATRPLVEDDIEEVTTRWRLRAEVFALHTGFSLAELTLTLTSAAKSLALLDTKTSRARSGKSSRRGKRRSRN